MVCSIVFVCSQGSPAKIAGPPGCWSSTASSSGGNAIVGIAMQSGRRISTYVSWQHMWHDFVCVDNVLVS